MPALGALDDPYAEIATFVASEVLPIYGQAIVPELQRKLDIKGRGGHVHRLLVIARLDPAAARPIVLQALEEGSKEIRIAAIECLGSSPEDLAFLLELSKARAKDVRAAALRALCRCEASEAADVLCGTMRTGAIEPAIEAVAASSNPHLARGVIDEVQAQWNALLASKEKDKAKTSKRTANLLLVLECLRGRQDQGAEAFLLRAFSQRDALEKISGEPGGKDVLERLASIMASGPNRVQNTLIDEHASLPEDELAEAFRAARRVRSPTEVFETFSPYLIGGFHFARKPAMQQLSNGMPFSMRLWAVLRACVVGSRQRIGNLILTRWLTSTRGGSTWQSRTSNWIWCKCCRDLGTLVRTSCLPLSLSPNSKSRAIRAR